MGMDANAGSITSQYARAASGSTDTGQGMANALGSMELGARARYADPTVPTNPLRAEGAGAEELSALGYNTIPSAPVKYSTPSAMKEYMENKQEIRKAIEGSQKGGTVMRTDPITDAEVDYLQQMKNQTELAKFDDYITSMIDVRKPGNMTWLMKVYPEYVERRLEQLKTDYEYSTHNDLIEYFGINTFDDLHFKFLVDQGRIGGPRMRREISYSDQYTPGLLSPYTWLQSRQGGAKLPWSESKHGWKPPDEVGRLKDRPMSEGNAPGVLASSMYQRLSGRQTP